jgi:hypothetical protein
MNEMHPKLLKLKATSGMYISLKSLPKPPSVLSASRTLRCISADDIYPIGVNWSPFLNSGKARKKVARLLSSKRKRPVLTGPEGLVAPCQGRL